MDEEELLSYWKEQYGEIFLTEINEVEFVYRLLTYREYIDLDERGLDTMEMDEKIAKMCVLDPIIEDWTEMIYAGFSSTLGQLIREQSLITPREDGTSDMKSMIAEESNKLETHFLMQVPLIIKHSFPEYSIEQIEHMSLKKQVNLYAKALWMMKNFEGLTMVFDEEE